METLSLALIKEALGKVNTDPFGAEVHYHPQIGSTNDVARDLASAGAPEGTLVIADEQTAGRGRMARRWVAPPNSSLLMSVIFRPSLRPDLAFRLVMACGLAIAQAVEGVAGVNVEVKWPNDLLIGGKKFVGILPEAAIMGEQLAWVVVGMGINVNLVFGPADPLFDTATSLQMATGQPYDRATLLACILAKLRGWHRRLDDAGLLDEWRDRCITLGQRVRIETPAGVLSGMAVDITSSGMLCLRDDSGALHHVTASEATVLRG